MSTTSRRKETSVVAALADNPGDYTFQQIVRLLERAAVTGNTGEGRTGSQPVARFTPPESEAIRFSSKTSLSFPAGEVSAVSSQTTHAGTRQWWMNIDFMGLAGSQGVLPFHYTELILQRLKGKDESIKRFFDLFNHRTVSLFFQASTKYRLPLEYERKRLPTRATPERDSHTRLLLALIGLGTDGLDRRLHVHDETLIYYSGLFSQQTRTASGLRQILQHHFNVPVEIREFVGQWQTLIDDVRTRLPGSEFPQGQNNCLGRSVMLGQQGWCSQGKISIIIGPLKPDQLSDFAPGTTTLKALNEIIRLYVGLEHDFNFKIKIRKRDIPTQTGLSAANPLIMGWNTWLSGSSESPKESDATTEISISAHHLTDTRF